MSNNQVCAIVRDRILRNHQSSAANICRRAEECIAAADAGYKTIDSYREFVESQLPPGHFSVTLEPGETRKPLFMQGMAHGLARKLVQRALDQGSSDNCTAVVVLFGKHVPPLVEENPYMQVPYDGPLPGEQEESKR
jgi:hypothetical protein